MKISEETQAACEEWYGQNEETASISTAFAAGMSFGIKKAAEIAENRYTEVGLIYSRSLCFAIADEIRKEWPTAEPNGTGNTAPLPDTPLPWLTYAAGCNEHKDVSSNTGCTWCDIAWLIRQYKQLVGIMTNDIASVLDDCVELGMTATEMRDVVRLTIEKAITVAESV